MALEAVEGFDQYGGDISKALAGNWAQFQGAQLTNDPVKVRTGASALLLTSGNTDRLARRVFPTIGTTKIVSFAARNTSELPTLAGRQQYLSFRDTNNLVQLQVFVATTGQLRVTNNIDYETFSVAPVISVGAYQSIQAKIIVNAVTGSFEIRVDNVPVVFDQSTTNINTDPTGFGSVGQYQFGGAQNFGSNPSPEWTIDDIFTLDDTGAQNNDFIGDKQAFLVLPDSDETPQDWTVTGAASGFQAINNVPDDGDTSYIEATIVTDQSQFGLQDIATSITNIAGVQMTHVVRKLDAGPAQIQGALISNAAAGLGLDRPITENYTHWNDVIELDPDGNIPWTAAKWNATEYRIEKTA